MGQYIDRYIILRAGGVDADVALWMDSLTFLRQGTCTAGGLWFFHHFNFGTAQVNKFRHDVVIFIIYEHFISLSF